MVMHVGWKKPTANINIAPLVDVVLVLLIIFMVLTPLAEKQKYLRVPENEDARLISPDQARPEQTILTALANGRVLLDAEELDLPDAMRRLAQAYRGNPSKPLFFNAQDRVPYEQAFKALDAAHEAGATTVGIMTDPPIVPPANAAPISAR